MRDERAALRVGLMGLILLAWLIYWAFRIQGAEHGLALLVGVLLVAALANQVAPVAWAGAWTDVRAWGAGAVLAACLVLVAGHLFRNERLDPPFMDPDQVAPVSWWLAAVLFLVGLWRLLGSMANEGPVCASCGAPALHERCAQCGAALDA